MLCGRRPDQTVQIRKALVIVLAVSVSSSEAGACLTRSSNYSMFYEQEPTHLNVPVIVELTIEGLWKGPWAYGRRVDHGERSYVGIARIDRVVKGLAPFEAIMVVGPTSSCAFRFQRGDSGFVAGTIVVDRDGEPVLYARADATEYNKARRALRNPGIPRGLMR